MKAIFIDSIGNLVEWYDFYAYTAFALYFKSLGQETWFYYYLSGMIFLSLLIYSTMRDTKHASAMHRHE